MNFSPDSKFYALCGRLVALCKINLLWIGCSLPVFTLGASTCAMLACLSEMNKDGEAHAGTFFRAFRQHFRRATILWLLMLLLGAMLAVDYCLVANMQFAGRMAVIAVICFCFFLLLLASGIIFPLLVRFPAASIKDTVVNAVLLAIANLPKMLLITAMNLLPALLLIVWPRIFFFLSFLLPICGFSLIALYDLNIADKIFSKLMPQEEIRDEQDGTA